MLETEQPPSNPKDVEKKDNNNRKGLIHQSEQPVFNVEGLFKYKSGSLDITESTNTTKRVNETDDHPDIYISI